MLTRSPLPSLSCSSFYSWQRLGVLNLRYLLPYWLLSALIIFSCHPWAHSQFLIRITGSQSLLSFLRRLLLVSFQHVPSNAPRKQKLESGRSNVFTRNWARPSSGLVTRKHCGKARN